MSEGLNTYQGMQSWLNITQATTVKAKGGRIMRVQVLVAGTAPGAVYDAPSPNGYTPPGSLPGTTPTPNGVANQVGVIPNAVGMVKLDMRCATGITVAPGAGQTVAVSYD